MLKNKGSFKRALTLACTVFALSACGNNNDSPGAGSQGADSGPDVPASDGAPGNLAIRNLMPVEGQHYEGWVIINGRPVSTGRFNVDSGGAVFSVDPAGARLAQIGSGGQAGFNFDGNVNAVSEFVLTVEPNNDADPAPNPVRLLVGRFQGNTTTARVTDPKAFGTDFASASGSFILATPTNGPATANQGVWFLKMEGGGERQALMLPKLAAGWTYEGWVVDNRTNQATSTGRFASGRGFDSDQAGPAAGPMANMCPAFPGQDFVNPPIVLNDGNHSVVITVEPNPETNPLPFPVRVLTTPVAASAPAMQNLPLQLSAPAQLPEMTVTLNR